MIQSIAYAYPNETLDSSGAIARENGEEALEADLQSLGDGNLTTGALFVEGLGTLTIGFQPSTVPATYPTDKVVVRYYIGEEVGKTVIQATLRFYDEFGDIFTQVISTFTGPGGQWVEIDVATVLPQSQVSELSVDKIISLALQTDVSATLISEVNLAEYYSHGGKINLVSGLVKQASGIIYL